MAFGKQIKRHLGTHSSQAQEADTCRARRVAGREMPSDRARVQTRWCEPHCRVRVRARRRVSVGSKIVLRIFLIEGRIRARTRVDVQGHRTENKHKAIRGVAIRPSKSGSVSWSTIGKTACRVRVHRRRSCAMIHDRNPEWQEADAWVSGRPGIQRTYGTRKASLQRVRSRDEIRGQEVWQSEFCISSKRRI